MNSQKPSICAEVQVMFFDTDSGGVVSNIAYLRFIEIAREAEANSSKEEFDRAFRKVAKPPKQEKQKHR